MGLTKKTACPPSKRPRGQNFPLSAKVRRLNLCSKLQKEIQPDRNLSTGYAKRDTQSILNIKPGCAAEQLR